MVSRRIKLSRWWQRVRGAHFLIGILLLTILIILFRPGGDSELFRSNLGFFVLVNINVIILGVLAFLIGRNVVKLVFDRKRKILGSRLRMRLVFTFVSLSLIPIVFVFILASGLLSKAMEGWFSSQVESSVDGALEIWHFQRETLKDGITRESLRIVDEIEARPAVFKDRPTLVQYLETKRKENGFFGIRIIDMTNSLVAEVTNAAAVIEDFREPEPDSEAVTHALGGEQDVRLEERGEAKYVRSYIPIRLGLNPAVLLSTIRIDPDLSHTLNLVRDSYEQYRQLEYYKNPIKSGYLLTLTLITALILFGAIWIGFYIAREISVPIQRLAEGTRAVARGDYDFKIKAVGDDEIGILVRSFNRMTSDLKVSRAQAENRRLYIDTTFAKLAVGVVGIDTERVVTSVNPAAQQILGLSEKQAVVGEKLSDLFSRTIRELVLPVVDQIEQEPSDAEAPPVEVEMSIPSRGRELKVLCTAGRITDLEGKWLGSVLLFDDLTELSKAQQMAVWREAAQRIAHEIKNPLTPIQLSAQRLLKKLSGTELGEGVEESAKTIVQNVASIKRLADEFSRFARMPTVLLSRTNINNLISNTVTSYTEGQTGTKVQLIADGSLPEAMVDQEQIRRILINLIENSITALDRLSGTERARIVVKTNWNPTQKLVTIEVADNGPGISDADKARIFEPYFTTKQKGTGLGLAIVTSIVSDHQGTIRVFDNKPHGTRFVVELPLEPKPVTQRRFANL